MGQQATAAMAKTRRLPRYDGTPMEHAATAPALGTRRWLVVAHTLAALGVALVVCLMVTIGPFKSELSQVEAAAGRGFDPASQTESLMALSREQRDSDHEQWDA